MAQRRSLSGRSPFCQRKLSEESQIQWKSVSSKATNINHNKSAKNTNHDAVSQRVQGRVDVAGYHWNKTVAWQAHTSLRLLLLKSFRIMLPTFIKYSGSILSWWTCGGPAGPKVTDQLWFIRDCENTRRVSPFRSDGPEPPLRCRRFAYGCAFGRLWVPVLSGMAAKRWAVVCADTATTDTLVLCFWTTGSSLGSQRLLFYGSFAVALARGSRWKATVGQGPIQKL